MSADENFEDANAHRFAFLHYLRTGEQYTVEKWLARAERKFNPYHDERDRFTSPPGATVSYGQTSMDGSQARNGIGGRPQPGPTISQESIAGRASPTRQRPVRDSRAGISRGRVAEQTVILPPKSLATRAHAVERGNNELLKMPKLDVVLFGLGVRIVPVPIASFQEFDAGAKLATRLSDLDVVITGAQFDLLSGSNGIHGQAVIGGRVYGRSAPGLYYFSTSTDDGGVRRLEFGKGDPPRTGGEVGIGGGVPLIINGQNVAGYDMAWNRYRRRRGIGKNIVAYNSSLNASAIFVQPDGDDGYSLNQIRDYIRRSGYDNAIMFDGSGSVSLNYRGKQIVSPEIIRQPLIPLGIGFRSR